MPADLPWFFDADGLPEGNTDAHRARAVGDGAMTSHGSHAAIGLAGDRMCLRTGYGVNYRWLRHTGAAIGEVLEFAFGQRMFHFAAGATGISTTHTLLLGCYTNAFQQIMALQHYGNPRRLSLYFHGVKQADLPEPPSGTYIECYVYVHATLGRYEIRYNGKPVASGTGTALEPLDTMGPSGADGVAWVQYASHYDINTTPGSGSYWTDLYQRTATNESRFYGPTLALHRKPTADILSGWDPSEGTDGYAMLDEDLCDDMGTTVSASATHAESLFTHESLPEGVQGVLAVVSRALVAAPLGGAVPISLTQQVGGTKHAAPARVCGTPGFSMIQTARLVDPAGTPWTPATASAASGGFLSVEGDG